jgi:hypothetical protein
MTLGVTLTTAHLVRPFEGSTSIPATATSEAFGVNARGQVVGGYVAATGLFPGNSSAFVTEGLGAPMLNLNAGLPSTLRVTVARGINDSGVIIGQAFYNASPGQSGVWVECGFVAVPKTQFH